MDNKMTKVSDEQIGDVTGGVILLYEKKENGVLTAPSALLNNIPDTVAGPLEEESKIAPGTYPFIKP